jgi:hypothetical protein
MPPSECRPPRRNGDGIVLRGGTPRLAARAARSPRHALLPAGAIDATGRGRPSTSAGRRHERPAVRVPACDEPCRRPRHHDARPDRVGALPPRWERLAHSPGARPPNVRAYGRGPRLGAGATRSGSHGSSATSQGSEWSATAARRWGNSHSSRWCRNAVSPRLVHELQPHRQRIQRADHEMGLGDSARSPHTGAGDCQPHGGRARAVLRALRDCRERHRRHCGRQTASHCS